MQTGTAEDSSCQPVISNSMDKNRIIICLLILPISLLGLFPAGYAETLDSSFREWSENYALGLLNESPWANNETYIRQLRGVGSGIQGEKEIYNTYFVRFLSASPVRKAFARIRELHFKNDGLSDTEQAAFREENDRTVNLDLKDWIVVSVAFRSNVPREESRVDQFLMAQTTETLKTRAYLSTDRFPRIEIAEYIAPMESIVGAKFIFPRTKDGVDIVTTEDEKIVFEFDAPGSDPLLRTTFNIKDMVHEGELVL